MDKDRLEHTPKPELLDIITHMGELVGEDAVVAEILIGMSQDQLREIVERLDRYIFENKYEYENSLFDE